MLPCPRSLIDFGSFAATMITDINRRTLVQPNMRIGMAIDSGNARAENSGMCQECQLSQLFVCRPYLTELVSLVA